MFGQIYLSLCVCLWSLVLLLLIMLVILFCEGLKENQLFGHSTCQQTECSLLLSGFLI